VNNSDAVTSYYASFVLGSSIPLVPITDSRPGQDLVVSTTTLISPTMTNEATWGFGKNTIDITPLTNGLSRTTTGINLPVLYAGAVQQDLIPTFAFNGSRLANTASFGTNDAPFHNYNTTLEWMITCPTTQRHTAHQQRPAEVTIYYDFHPLRAHSLPVIRQYDFHDEVHYVVRMIDGRPLAVPAWMTCPEAANTRIVSAARLPVRVLLELRRVTEASLSSRMHNVHEEDDHAAASGRTPTTTLRRTASRSRRTSPAGRARAAAPSSCAVDASAGQNDARGGGRR
jgi:hypothetical protein